MDIVSRKEGRSVMAEAAYCAGEARYSEYEGEWKYPHSDPSRVVYQEVLLPPNAPREYSDPQTLWNAVDAAEDTCVAQTARKFIIAMPRELTLEQNKELIRDYCQKEFVDKGMIVDLYYHDENDGNPHVHLLLTMRAMDEKGKWLAKTRSEYVLDENGNRIRIPSGRFKRITVPTVDWNDHKYGEIWRHDWGEMQNAALEKAGSDVRVDMRSLKRQGITDREPQVHMGPAAAAMERKGIVTAIGEQNRSIIDFNKVLSGLKRTFTSLKIWLKELTDTIKDIKTIEEPKSESLLDVLIAYQNMRKRERADWNPYAREKGGVHDLKEFASSFAYMKEHDIRTLDDLADHLDNTGRTVNDLNNKVKRNSKRIRDINDLLDAVKVIADLEPIENELKGKRFGRDKFIEAHKADLDKLHKKRYLVDKLSQGKPIDKKALLAESARLQKEIEDLQPDINTAQISMEHLREIRHMVRKVIPDALPSHKKGEQPFLREELESGQNANELERMKDRVADKVIRMNPTQQIPVQTEHRQNLDQKKE